MAQYLLELSWDGVSVTPSGPVDATWDETDPLAGVLVRGTLHDSAGTQQFFGLQLLLYAHSYGGGPTYELVTCQRPWSSGLTEFALGFPFVPNPATGFFQAPNGEGGSHFLSPPTGPTLSVLVDDGANSVTYTGPLGTFTATFASLGWANGTLQDISLGSAATVFAPPTSSGTHTFSASFFNYYLSFNGTRREGAELGALDPGTWTTAPWSYLVLSGASASATLASSTDDARLNLGWSWDSGVNNPGVFESLANWDSSGGFHLKDVETLLHALKHPYEGVFLYARVIKQNVDAIEVGYSRDLGHTWTTVLAGQTAGRYYQSPSLAASPDGVLNLFANDRHTKLTYWFKSYDYGMSWTAFGLLLSGLPWSTITHPKVFVAQNGFFIVGYNAGSHFFVGTFDSGSGTAIATHDFGVNAGGFDTYPAIWEDPKGILYVAFEAVALESEYRSIDNGVDWDLVYQAALLSQQVVMARDPDSPFLWKLFQGPSSGGTSDLNIQGSDNNGITSLTSAVVIVAAIPEQYSGLIVGPKGELLAIRQLYNSGSDSWSIQPWISKDYGQSWAPA